jgi:aldose 1-epimerase
MPDGTAVHRICLEARLGDKVCGASIITRGATVQEVMVPDKDGTIEDIALGFDRLEGYNGGANFCYGGTPGRYANRIKEGKFELEGQTHNLIANWTGASGKAHTLHGGKGFDGKVWSIAQGPWVDGAGAHVTLSYTSEAGECGFPGTLVAKVTYSWQAIPETSTFNLNIKWEATCDRSSVVNLTNHSYFNLMGVKTASQVLDTHTVTLNCDTWTAVNEDAIPSGELTHVQGTPMDFRTPKLVGKDIGAAQGGGYDHNFAVNGYSQADRDVQRFVGRVDCASGRRMDCWATQPGVQFFTMQPACVFDKSTHGKYGQVYPVHGGLCLETQHFPDSPNQPSFPSTVITPIRPYLESCQYRFSVV